MDQPTTVGASAADTPQGSNAALRTVRILDFFADHPGAGFTLTEIGRAARISPATCLSILTALVSGNYLIRDNAKRYFLGPALGRLAAAAKQAGTALELAKPEMRRLADDFDVICSAIFAEDREAVVRERMSSISHVGWASQLGRRFPLKPPFGTVFYAWAQPDAVNGWISRSADAGVEEDRLEESLGFARAQGFAMGLRTEALQGDAHARSLTYRTDKTDYLAASLEDTASYDLAFVSAPVFGGDGEIAFALALMGFTARVDGADIRTIGQTLRRACDSITRASGGRLPDIAR